MSINPINTSSTIDPSNRPADAGAAAGGATSAAVASVAIAAVGGASTSQNPSANPTIDSPGSCDDSKALHGTVEVFNPDDKPRIGVLYGPMYWDSSREAYCRVVTPYKPSERDRRIGIGLYYALSWDRSRAAYSRQVAAYNAYQIARGNGDKLMSDITAPAEILPADPVIAAAGAAVGGATSSVVSDAASAKADSDSRATAGDASSATLGAAASGSVAGGATSAVVSGDDYPAKRRIFFLPPIR